jgi:hypothetical protein
MNEAVCPSCGAGAIDEAGKCVYCGTQRQPSAGVGVSTAGGRRTTPKENLNSPEFLRRELVKEISFLEGQYRDTAHPSILKKLENAQNKLRALA